MRHSGLRIVIAVIVVGVFVACLGPAWADKDKTCNPVIDPQDFVREIDNPYSPLVPGTTFVYEGQTPDGLDQDVVSVTHDKKKILGVTCIVVRDTETVGGVLQEDTIDWYAQDKEGNVWYFGEFATQYAADGVTVIGHEGSWEAGVDGAQPGIVMLADPRPGDSYRQEFLAGVAEDMARVLRLNANVSVPYGDFEDCLATKEWSPLERGAIEHKFYAPGVGLVLTEELKGKTFRSELVEIITE
jgi:hypothetical protein